ncbi:MAG TPA: hypothetical protein DEH78_17795 [Solibacterales bacterium]|nr:hypothetical protein [Bryobacterales bacterium]
MTNGRIITIRLVNGDVIVTPPKVKAKRGETVEWVCDDGPFAIQFDGISPMRSIAFRGPARSPQGSAVREDAQIGTYKYTVALSVDGAIYIEDPQMVIEDA